jgi:hypothetical protein
MAFHLKGLVGHVTSSVSDRYHIVSETDLHEAAQKLNEHKSGRNDGSGCEREAISH